MNKLLVVFILLIGTVLNVQGNELQNNEALEGVTNTNAIFDISPGGKRLLGQLNIIYKTYEQLNSFGQEPSFILAFRGSATKFITTDDKYVSEEDLDTKRQIQQKIKDFKKLGVTMELCAIAADSQRIDQHDFLPGIEVVANGYISVIGYQSKGYNLVPIY